MTRQTRQTTEQKFQFYATAEECADAAAPLFREKRWRWAGLSIPDREQILEMLQYLEREAVDDGSGNRFLATGRLVYDAGRFGHERVTA